MPRATRTFRAFAGRTIWDAGTGSCEATLEGHRGSVEPCAFSPDGRRIVSGSDDKASNSGTQGRAADYGAVEADDTLHGAPGLGLDVRLIALLHAKVCLATLVPELALEANVVLFGNQPMEGLFPRPLASALVQVARQDDCLVCRPLRGEPPPTLRPRR